ncbi:DUF2752 domain-containing protein [Porphyromonas crevioricanis]|uniref:DUF2752 domain-containing protein n=1 Tax=Porphyromonas crevioricanis TaxID=393921 RepID=UPI00099B03A3|nr:DUF2752 domain-containing protein [Porphyromonas crevioricanis]SJZ66860.1 Protein of unknown function [Porphyromonas crevioricanis]
MSKFVRSGRFFSTIASLCHRMGRRWFLFLPIGLLPVIFFWESQPLHCPIRQLTGYPCPGCGTLRALRLLLQGDWFAAVEMNPLAVLFAFYLLFSSLFYLFYLLSGSEFWHPNRRRIPPWGLAFLILLVIANGIRNIILMD